MIERKIQKRYIDRTAGIPVVLLNVPMVKIYGEWTPDINYRVLDKALCAAIATKDGRLTGSEIRFARMNMRATLDEFADLFSVTRQAVMKWEKSADEATSMGWSVEKDIRLTILNWLGVDPKRFKQIFELLQEKRTSSRARLRIPAQYARFKSTKQLLCAVMESGAKLWCVSSKAAA